MNAEDVDFTALVGDFSDGRVDEVSDTLAPFADLTPGDASGFVTGAGAVRLSLLLDHRRWLNY